MLYSAVETAAEVARFCKEMFLEKYFVKNSILGIRTLDLWITRAETYPLLHNDIMHKVRHEWTLISDHWHEQNGKCYAL